jgi:alpha-L-rhamnosidase
MTKPTALPDRTPKAGEDARAPAVFGLFLLLGFAQTHGGKRMNTHCIVHGWRALACAGLVLGAVAMTASAATHPAALRCEYNFNPQAVDVPQPRLSWVLEADPSARGVAQSAYQILVASSAQLLDKDTGDLWDSGQVVSDQSVNVVYAGKALASAQVCFWKVKVWDQAGATAGWSQPAQWTMGLLQAGDWKARWIGFDGPPETGTANESLRALLQLRGSSWVWSSDARTGNQPPGDVYFRKLIVLPADRKVKQAAFLLTADDAFSLFINGHMGGQGTSWKVLSSVDVTGRLQAGTNALGVKVSNGGATPSPAGLVGKLAIQFESGEPMVVPIDQTWLASPKAGERWPWPDFEALGWTPAKAIARMGDQPWGELKPDETRMLPAPFLRKTFAITKPLKRAVIFASALGVYELHLNGKAVGNDVLSPGWTDYRKRVHYFGYDVTSQARPGENVLGAILGDGWYAGYLAFSGKRHYYGDKPRLIVQMRLDYEDGTTETIGTDPSWKAAYGPIREGDLLMGSLYDAQKEMPGWDTAGFNDATWQAVVMDEAVKANLEAHPGSPMRRLQEVPAKTVTEPRLGVYVFNLGQNMVGWVRLQARGQAGQLVVVRHAEMLNPDGTVYTANLRAAKAVDTYLLAGGEKRAYEPGFTFHGFQYVEVTGLDYKPDAQDVTGIVVHSDVPRASSFQCSEPLVNKLVDNTYWGQRGNFLDVPTDCPQRDERAGWTGDAQVFMKTACFNMDAPAFFTKWLLDLCADSQRDDGALGDVAPHVSIVGFGNTGWADAGPVCNWQMLKMYGDTRVIERHYPALSRYMDYLARTSKGYVRGTGAYGDWLRLAGPQHSDAIGTAYYFYSSRLMGELAEAIGKADDARRYRQQAQAIQEVFVKRFIKADGRIVDDKNQTGQTFYALAFGLDLVPASLAAKAADQFVEEVKKQDWHLATGFLGTPFVLFALDKAGHPELAYRMVLNKTYPSWLQQVIWGSSTMWERWDGWRPDKGFQDAGMNSFNHYWLGCVDEWLFTSAAGLDTDGPGFKRVTIRPVLDPSGQGLSWVRASYASIRGTIATAWKIENGQFNLDVTIPGNCTATVFVPAKDANSATEGGQPATQAAGVKFLWFEHGCAVFAIGSGQYHFASPR